MRSVTLVQGFQYWLKVVAIMLPVLLLLAAWRADGTPSALADVPPTFRTATTVQVGTEVALVVPAPVVVGARGSIDGDPVAGEVTLGTGRHVLAAGTHLDFPAGAEVPHAEGTRITTGSDWGRPLRSDEHPMYRTYALMLALFLGTMGLPHVLVRFYTNPDGRQARRTALIVIALVGLFYLAPSVYGMLGRIYTPQLLMTGRTDAVVLLLPAQVLGGGPLGQGVTALVCAGAAAAFLATATGLTVTVAGVISQDVVSRWVPDPIRSFRWAAVVSVLVPLALGLLASSLPLAQAVALAFTVAAATFCPLLLLGIWWPRLTDAGAFTGLVAGGSLAVGAILASSALPDLTGWPAALLSQPAAWAMPIALATMVLVSRATAHRLHPGVSRIMIRLHTPESARLRTSWTAKGNR